MNSSNSFKKITVCALVGASMLLGGCATSGSQDEKFPAHKSVFKVELKSVPDGKHDFAVSSDFYVAELSSKYGPLKVYTPQVYLRPDSTCYIDYGVKIYEKEDLLCAYNKYQNSLTYVLPDSFKISPDLQVQDDLSQKTFHVSLELKHDNPVTPFKLAVKKILDDLSFDYAPKTELTIQTHVGLLTITSKQVWAFKYIEQNGQVEPYLTYDLSFTEASKPSASIHIIGIAPVPKGDEPTVHLIY